MVVNYNSTKHVLFEYLPQLKQFYANSLELWPRLAEAFKLFSAFSQEQSPKRKIGSILIDHYVQALVVAKKLESSRLQESPCW